MAVFQHSLDKRVPVRGRKQVALKEYNALVKASLDKRVPVRGRKLCCKTFASFVHHGLDKRVPVRGRKRLYPIFMGRVRSV